MAKYGNEWGGWCTKSVSGAHGVCLWKSIRKGWLNFSKFLWYDVGDGTCVKFWVDVWCRDRPLKEVFPDLYNISRTRDASVSDVLCYANGRIFLDLKFRHLVNDQESQSLDLCMVLIYSTKVRGVGFDKLSWKPANSRGFVVSGFYHSLSPSTATPFLWKLMWQSKVPPGLRFSLGLLL